MDTSPFDVSVLTERDLGHIEYVLTSPSYSRVFRPFLMSIHNTCMSALLDNSEERRRKTSDECLIERAKAVKSLIFFFDKIVDEAQVERIHRARGDDFNDYEKTQRVGLNARFAPTQEELPLEEQY